MPAIPQLRRSVPRAALLLLVAAGSPSVAGAQLSAGAGAADSSAAPSVPSVPSRAYAGGYSPAAGLIGVEMVSRPREGGRLGWAAGMGPFGAGARLNVQFARRQSDLAGAGRRRHAPYIAAGVVATPFLPLLDVYGAATLEGGVQFWPAARGKLYVDLGLGAAAVFTGDGVVPGPVLRLLFGRAR